MKHLPILLITCCLLALSCKEKKETPPVIQKPQERRFTFPERPMGFVSDFDKLLTPGQVAYLDSLIGEHEKATTNQVAVVTLAVDTNLVKTVEDLENFSVELFNRWGVGQAEKNNGVGILIDNHIRRMRISVGSGLEQQLTNEEASRIIAELITPAFKKQDYFTGIRDGIEAIFREIQ